ncbi:MAG TPA: TIGR03013 family XrtA/PEP-CTERM system glycosyltransferase [Terracidiphilus sp.]|nr:TIGR03013 family XrtA/PEP-CTERM system glycosyltransferase [Terracidiphilus sp.]
MTRLFNVYYPTRTLVRVLCEVIFVSGSYLLATILFAGPDWSLVLIYENGLLKIAVITAFTLLLTYYFDLYGPRRFSAGWEIYFRLLLVLSVLSFVLAGLVYLFPELDIGPNVFLAGTLFLVILLVLWRGAYEWIIGLPMFSERVYVLGNGPRAHAVVELLRTSRDAGMKIVGWKGKSEVQGQLERFSAELREFRGPNPGIDRVLVAMEDRRESMPVRELLDLRICGVVIENSSTLVERLSGKLPLDGLNPSNLIFTEGFRMSTTHQLFRRLLSFAVSFVGLVICLPLIPFIILAVRLSSPGPILFSQARVGKRGYLFTIYKFRTMRENAEAQGAVWATKDDPRITPIGRFMRKTRLDEIPQLWNVLRGEMAFVGPRPERPEFVQWLSKEIPFYDLRHMIRPGITGWAQVRYQYGASLEETKHKLEYDLYYVKHQSISLDLLIMFETIKTIILRRGAQ